MKKFITLLLTLSMLFVMTACGNDFESEDLSEVANPIVECKTAEELVKATGISLDAPSGAKDVTYSYINTTVSGDGQYLAQVEFKLDGKSFCYRAQETSKTSLLGGAASDPNVSAEALTAAMSEAIEEYGEFAGLYDEWGSSASVDIAQTREGIVAFNDGKSGFIAWLDVAPGVQYCLSMLEKCTQDLLMTTAEKCFIPMQGDAK